jgi:hypothetical protein
VRNPFVLAVRFYVEPREAQAALGFVQSVVACAATITASRVVPYWKDPGLVEVFVDAVAPDGAARRFEEVRSGLGSCWETLFLDASGGDAVWNHWRPGSTSDVPGARWGNLIFFPLADCASGGKPNPA